MVKKDLQLNKENSLLIVVETASLSHEKIVLMSLFS